MLETLALLVERGIQQLHTSLHPPTAATSKAVVTSLLTPTAADVMEEEGRSLSPQAHGFLYATCALGQHGQDGTSAMASSAAVHYTDQPGMPQRALSLPAGPLLGWLYSAQRHAAQLKHA